MSKHKMCESCDGTGVAGHQRKDPEVRRQEILEAAVEVASEQGYLNLTHLKVAGRVEVSPSLVRKYYETKSTLREAVMAEAVRLSIPEIVLQGLAAFDPIAQSAPAALRVAALESCA